MLPDFIANAGGVICGSVEYHGGSESQAAKIIEERITENVSAMLEIVSSDKVTPRTAAEQLARETGIHLDALGEIEFFLGRVATDADAHYADDVGYHAAAPFGLERIAAASWGRNVLAYSTTTPV